jgi:hypothetical protein
MGKNNKSKKFLIREKNGSIKVYGLSEAIKDRTVEGIGIIFIITMMYFNKWEVKNQGSGVISLGKTPRIIFKERLGSQ